MRNSRIIPIAMIIITAVCTGCYAGITGRVIDAETQQPIEGAVVLVEWTKTKGLPGMTYGETYKTVESITNKEGRFEASGVINPMVNPPIVAIYKKGFVIWSSHYIFPLWVKRTDVKLNEELTIQLEQFKETYSHAEHVAFISSAAVSGSGGKYFSDAYLWEWKQVQQEKQKFKMQDGERR